MNAPAGVVVDHKYGEGLDNRRANLRLATPAQNSHNRSKGRNKTSSRYKGVYLVKETKKWRASICHNNKRIHLGFFKNETDAAKAYDGAAKEYFKEFASLNFE